MPFDDTPKHERGEGGDGDKKHSHMFLELLSQLMQSQMLGTIDKHGGCRTCSMVYAACDILAKAVMLAGDSEPERAEYKSYILLAIDEAIEERERIAALATALENFIGHSKKGTDRDDTDKD